MSRRFASSMRLAPTTSRTIDRVKYVKHRIRAGAPDAGQQRFEHAGALVEPSVLYRSL